MIEQLFINFVCSLFYLFKDDHFGTVGYVLQDAQFF